MPIDAQLLDACEAELTALLIPPEILRPCRSDPVQQAAYHEARQVFNRKFDFMPPMIIKVKDSLQVSIFVAFATKHTLPFTVRSGGHDHEGESVATGKVLLDFSLMNQVELKPAAIVYEGRTMQQLAVEPGARFECIKPVLDTAHIAIAHGTCKTVAIAGYTMGGGWGPWTRKHGMGCERLTGATLVLGSGEIRYLGTSAVYYPTRVTAEIEQQNKELLWALRGGGGLSYGIVTELFFEPFDLPPIAKSFVIKRTDFPVLSQIKAVDVIAAWEQMIAPCQNPNLIGTNLQVIAMPVASAQDISADAQLDWTFNGHFGGTKAELLVMVLQWFDALRKLANQGTLGKPLLEQKDEQSIKDNFDKIMPDDSWYIFDPAKNNSGYPLDFEGWDRLKNGLSLENDCPAPHKITSRMPTPDWNERSREQLVCSLQSPLLNNQPGNSVSAYITLGAISGSYYANKLAHPVEQNNSVSFPFQTSAFTIQYQAWWDQPSGEQCSPTAQDIKESLANRFAENRAQDWIETCRDFSIDNTQGSFISFKDASVPTFKYFGDNYQQLIEVKCNNSQDPKNLFRSRKTII